MEESPSQESQSPSVLTIRQPLSHEHAHGGVQEIVEAQVSSQS
jgi:hypothetical protein